MEYNGDNRQCIRTDIPFSILITTSSPTQLISVLLVSFFIPQSTSSRAHSPVS